MPHRSNATYGLSIVGGRSTAGQPGLTRGETEKALREGAVEPARTRLARAVREAATGTRDEAEFVRRLAKAGLSVRPRYADDTRARVVGYAVGFGGTGARTVLYGGGSLAPDLTLPKLREYWETTTQERQAALGAWGGAANDPGGREDPVVTEGWTRQALEALDAANEALQGVPATDHAQWAAVAREAAGVYAAWSRRIEGDRPGPLARAADALAVSAQVPKGTPGPVRPTHRGFRGAAMVVTQGRLGHEDRGTGWALLLGQLNRTLGLLSRVHEARGELHQASRLQGVTGDLERLTRGATPTAGTTRGRPQVPARSTLGLTAEDVLEIQRQSESAPEYGQDR